MPHRLSPSADTGGAAETDTTFRASWQCSCGNSGSIAAPFLADQIASLRARLTESETKLSDAIERERELRGAGGMLANVAFNLAQRGSGHSDFMQTLDSCYRNWDRVVEKHVTARAALTPPEPT